MRLGPESLPPFANGFSLCERELIACQQLAQLLPQAAQRTLSHQQGGRHSPSKGRGMAFAEVRQYQAGDDVRTIDWRVTARTGKTHTKLFHEERERPVYLLADLRGHTHIGSQLLTQAVQIAHVSATLSWHAIQAGDKVGTLCVHPTGVASMKPKPRRQGALNTIACLMDSIPQTIPTVTAAHAAPLIEACQQLKRLVKSGSQLWFITDGQYCPPTCLDTLGYLKRFADIRVVCVTDPLLRGNIDFPRTIELPIATAQGTLIMDYDHYQQWVQEKSAMRAQLQQHCATWQIPMHTICSAQPLSQQIVELHRS
jgi:hypothetical protein